MFATKVQTSILDAHPIDKGDALTDRAFVLSKFALAGEGSLLATGAAALLPPLIADLERFVVNLSGGSNEVTDNNVQSRNAALDGGVVLQLPSGLGHGQRNRRRANRRDGDGEGVAGPSRPAGRGQPAQRHRAAAGEGQRTASYALAIPTLTAGNYSILDNAMDGSVMIGAEPFAATGLGQAGGPTLAFGNFIHVAHVLAFDGKSYSSAVATAATPAADYQRHRDRPQPRGRRDGDAGRERVRHRPA